MPIKEWPSDPGEIVSFEELINPIRKSIENVYAFKRKHKKAIPYDGYNTGSHERVGCPPPDEWLDSEMLKYDSDRGRDPLDTLLNIAFQLGMEQGRRLTYADVKHYKNLYEAVKLALDNLLAKEPKPTVKEKAKANKIVKKLWQRSKKK